MAKRRVRYTKKTKGRMIVIFLFFWAIISTLGYSLFNNLKQISDMNKEKKYLEDRIVMLEEEEKVLEADIQKLSDPSYVARYAREKYLYSKDGELIIRIPD